MVMDKTHQGGLRILFADDEAHLRDLMQMELPRLGHEVTVCPDGAAALRAIVDFASTPSGSTRLTHCRVSGPGCPRWRRKHRAIRLRGSHR